MKVCGARVHRRSTVTLDGERADPVQAEEHRGGESDHAAAGDQDGNALLDRRGVATAGHHTASDALSSQASS